MTKKLLYFSLIFNIVFLALAGIALYRFGGVKSLWARINNRGVDKIYHHRKNLFTVLPARDNSIVFLGNSITAQGEWAELFNNPNILNRGISGDHCDGVRSRLPEIEKLNPSAIYLMIGINDLAYHPPEIVFEKYKKLIGAILEKMPGTVLYLQSVLPVNNKVSPTPIANADVRLLNDRIQSLAKEKSLKYIDLYAAMLDANGNLDAAYTQDGLHLNGRAYMKWKEVLEMINDKL